MIAIYLNFRSENKPFPLKWARVIKINALVCAMLLATLSVIGNATADDSAVDLAQNYPTRYTVVDGDTLWAIAGRFLRDPWRWPEVWKGNPQVDNPDLIYPGDVLVLTFVDGQPTLRSLRRETVKLQPTARVIDFRDAIPPIDPRAIQAYLTAPLVTDEEEMENAGYIVSGSNQRLIMGKYDQFYARGIEDQEADEYRIFRPGRHFVDPVSKESLGWEAEHVGDARMLRAGDPSKLTLLKTYTDASIRDRLRPVYKKESLPFFYPKAPDNAGVRGHILPTKTETTELGPLSVVAISLGKREGVMPGDVFRIKSRSIKKKDPVTSEDYFIPEEKSGLLLVFRSFNKVSYAIITNSQLPIAAGDIVVSPELE